MAAAVCRSVFDEFYSVYLYFLYRACEMELSWLMRIRIAGAMVVGGVLIGWLAWPMALPYEPDGAVTLFSGDLTGAELVITVVLGFIAGFLGYFAAYPYGLAIGPLAAPAGLAVWSLRSGPMMSLVRLNHTVQQREVLYNSLRWEGFYWLAVVIAGYFGVLLASKLVKSRSIEADSSNLKRGSFFPIVLSVVVSFIVAHMVISLLVQDVRMYDAQLGSVVGQPANVQIGFGVLAAFLAAAFICKLFLKMSYIVPGICTAIVTFFGITISTKPDVLNYMVDNWPVALYARSICGTLPIQLVSFGVIGAITGYWLAIKYDYWRKEQA
jgi:hypothetical protein